MKIAVLQEPHKFDIINIPVPDIQPDEVFLRVAACGVCTSELDIWEGRADGVSFPRYPGHEVSGIVERVGADVSNLKEGDRVAAWVTEKGFSEYVAVKAQYCLNAGKVPLEMALAEPLGCAVNAVELAEVSLGDDVVIVGAGFMGNLVQKLVNLRGPRQVIVVDNRFEALERACSLGATHVINAATQSPEEAVKSLTEGKGADISFEVTGMQAPLLYLGDVTRMSGKIVFVGYHQGGMRQIPLAQWNYMAFQMINAHFREVSTIMRGMRIGMRLLTSDRLSMNGLVTHRFPLDEINRAFQLSSDKPDGYVKSTVCMDGTR